MSILKKELLIFGVLLFVGLIVLPLCVYIVGQNFVGEYSPDAGAAGLLTTIWGDFVRFRAGAWILVLSPWLVIQLLRLAIHLFRRPGRSTDPARSTDIANP